MSWMKMTVPTIFSEGTMLQGNLFIESSVQFHGQVEGNIEHRSREALHIGKTAYIQGNIHSLGIITIEGKVIGEIRSSAKVKLLGSARIRGVIEAPLIEMEQGASVEGGMKVLKK